MNPFDFFSHIYCINLDRRPDRWQNCVTEFRRLGILDRVERFSAVDEMDGGMGCTRSHQQLLADAVKRSFKTVLVFEDDLCFKHADVLPILSRSLRELRGRSWGLFYLGLNPLGRLAMNGRHLVQTNGAYCAHAYAYTRETAQALLADKTHPFDTLLAKAVSAKTVQAFATYPLLCSQSDGYSDIQKTVAQNGAHIEERFNAHVSLDNQLVIFSKNRPLQLHACLSSIFKNQTHCFPSVTVLYSADTPFMPNYARVFEEFSSVRVEREKDFKPDLIRVVGDSELTTFMTDDDLLFQTVDLDDVRDIARILGNPKVVCFSLRLGRNITESYMQQTSGKLTTAKATSNTLLWKWRGAPHDFGYPLSLDGHIFRTDFVRSHLLTCDFHSPNTFEGNIQRQLQDCPAWMGSFRSSRLVNLPINRVQSDNNNRFGVRHAYSETQCDELFSKGMVIDIDALDLRDISSCHQEFPLQFKSRRPL